MMIFIGIGGNKGGAAVVEQRFQRAVEYIENAPYVRRVRLSELYESAPVGALPDQATFLNAAAGIELAHECAPHQILRDLLFIETCFGRARYQEQRGGPRPLDLDLLLWGEQCCTHPGPPQIILPHPELHKRKFALRPLADLAAAHVVPGIGATIAQLLSVDEVRAQRVEPVRSLTWTEFCGLRVRLPESP